MCLHYGQEVFEGLKAYKTPDGGIQLFRPDKNMARLNVSNDRLCIPAVDEAFCVEAIKKLVEVDADWIPTAPGTSLYIRPYIFAIDPANRRSSGTPPLIRYNPFAGRLIFCRRLKARLTSTSSRNMSAR